MIISGEKDKNSVRYEKRDVNLLYVFGMAAVIIIFLVVIVIFLTDYFIESKEKIVFDTHYSGIYIADVGLKITKC